MKKKPFLIHPAGMVLPILSAACDVTARIGKCLYKAAECCVHILIIKGKKSVMDVSLFYLS